MDRQRVLFLCAHNAARSQMAEALLRHHGGERFEALSAGLEPTEIHPHAPRVLEEEGIDTRDLRADASIRSRQTLYWPFEDPAGFQGAVAEQIEKFRQVRDRIDERLRSWLAEAKILS